ncbi:unnamed protein product [Chrysoparadoxa australica]
MAFSGKSGSALILNAPGETRSLPGFASNNDIIVKVHPVVLFSILDHHLRRSENQTRVIGTLMGKISANVVEITNSFAVPHSEKDDEVAVGKEFNRQMFSLQQRVNSMEQIVGWYATSFDGAPIVDSSSLIHEFYTSECSSPVHLVVDTALQHDEVGVKAFISSPLEVGGAALANVFHQVKVQLESTEAERICTDRMVKGQEEPFTSSEGLAAVESDATKLEASMKRLLAMLKQATAYVDGCCDGSITPDPAMGRSIADSLAVVLRMKPEEFAKLFDNNLQDLLMIGFLSSITKTQLALAEKLTAH